VTDGSLVDKTPRVTQETLLAPNRLWFSWFILFSAFAFSIKAAFAFAFLNLGIDK
jgi:hypothetical protein